MWPQAINQNPWRSMGIEIIVIQPLQLEVRFHGRPLSLEGACQLQCTFFFNADSPAEHPKGVKVPVSVTEWLKPFQGVSLDDREHAEILAECQLMHLADAYVFFMRCWQRGEAGPLMRAGRVLEAIFGLDWISAEEAEAWRARWVARLQASYSTAADFLQALESMDASEAWITLWSQGRSVADFPHWSAEIEPVSDAPLKVRKGPLGYALAARASSFPLFQQALDDPQRLRQAFWPDVESTLQEYWQVDSAESCRQLLYWLAGQGQRYAWQLDHQWLQEASDEEHHTWQEELPDGMEGYAEQMLNALVLPQLDVAAWDWVRMADLALAGYMAGYLSASEWRSFALVALWLLKRRYASWEAIHQSYLLGYRFWRTQSQLNLSPEIEESWQLLLEVDFSPQRQLNWQALNVDHPDFRDAVQLFSAGLEAGPLLVSLLASVRDDACVLTGLHSALPDEREQEAKEFLLAHVEVDLEEGLRNALTRFWQPGRVHHYDQLALNCRTGVAPSLPPNLGAVAEVWQAWHQQQPLLAGLVKHPAGIVMAEKYAFYLVKAQESGLFAASEIAHLTLAVQDYLSWHYPDAESLLASWQAWDEVLCLQGDERPLAAELAWHRQDPGSLFHFVAWKRPPARLVEPGRPVSETELALLNLVGPLTGIHWSWPERLPSEPADELRQLLQETHLFHSPEDLKDYLQHLYSAGDRQEYLVAFSIFTLHPARLDQELELQEQDEARDEEQETYYQRLLRVKHNTLGVNDVDLCAWDLVQLIDLAVAGYQLGWLDQQELALWLEKTQQLLTQSYTGWSDFAGALLAGYNFFMNEGPQRGELLEVFSQRLLGLLIAVPPQAGLWSTLHWPGAPARRWQDTSHAHLAPKKRLH